ncbi:MAG: nucleotidyltransferase domain-containing protein [Actinomycetota bacterium]
MDEAAIVAALREAGAKFGYLFGSRARKTSTEASDTDIAAWFGGTDETVWDRAARLPSGVDLLVLDEAPLELAGRVAMEGRLLFDDDPPARVSWEATTRKIWLDERLRIQETRRIFVEGARSRGRR